MNDLVEGRIHGAACCLGCEMEAVAFLKRQLEKAASTKFTWNSISVAGDDSSSWDVLAHSVHVFLISAEVLLLRASDGADKGDSRPVRVVDVHEGLTDAIGELIFEDSLSGSFRGTSSIDDDLFWLRSVVSADKLPNQDPKSRLERLVVDDGQTRILVMNAVDVLRATLRS